MVSMRLAMLIPIHLEATPAARRPLISKEVVFFSTPKPLRARTGASNRRYSMFLEELIVRLVVLADKVASGALDVRIHRGSICGAVVVPADGFQRLSYVAQVILLRELHHVFEEELRAQDVLHHVAVAVEEVLHLRQIVAVLIEGIPKPLVPGHMVVRADDLLDIEQLLSPAFMLLMKRQLPASLAEQPLSGVAHHREDRIVVEVEVAAELRRNMPRRARRLQVEADACPVLDPPIPPHPVACLIEQILNESAARLGNVHEENGLGGLLRSLRSTSNMGKEHEEHARK
mmetsp:Transcript_17393/g.66244  ORF Transcript_17393/g.66244 Transcript_17393/m.66244 type:complete len:288 (+) Transcript_17393:1655-2518(+)